MNTAAFTCAKQTCEISFKFFTRFFFSVFIIQRLLSRDYLITIAIENLYRTKWITMETCVCVAAVGVTSDTCCIVRRHMFIQLRFYIFHFMIMWCSSHHHRGIAPLIIHFPSPHFFEHSVQFNVYVWYQAIGLVLGVIFFSCILIHSFSNGRIIF